MGHLWDIAQNHLDRYGVRDAALARRMGTRPQTLNSWKNRGVRKLPDRELLAALSRETGTPYVRVVEAALRDAGYLAEERLRGHQPAAKSQAGGSPAYLEHIIREELSAYFDAADEALRQSPRGRDAILKRLRARTVKQILDRLAAERPDSAQDVG